jgi:nucleotide-binding universal stress UspA family protein
MPSEVAVSFQRILVAVDEEPVGARAADVGLELAKALGAKVALIYVVDPSTVAAPDGGIPANELIARAQEDGRRLLAGFRPGIAPPSIPLEFVQIGAPASEIVKTAAQWLADLIVIGSHGRGGVSRALLGSVAEAVMRHAPCPVLVIRAHA